MLFLTIDLNLLYVRIRQEYGGKAHKSCDVGNRHPKTKTFGMGIFMTIQKSPKSEGYRTLANRRFKHHTSQFHPARSSIIQLVSSSLYTRPLGLRSHMPSFSGCWNMKPPLRLRLLNISMPFWLTLKPRGPMGNPLGAPVGMPLPMGRLRVGMAKGSLGSGRDWFISKPTRPSILAMSGRR